MGLDNGIDVRGFPKDIAYCFNFDVAENDKGELSWSDVCYWRKCWDIRDIIIKNMKGKFVDNQGGSLSAVNLRAIISDFKHYLMINEETWYEYYSNRNIWSYEIMRTRILEDIETLTILYTLMEVYPEIEVDFYDAY